jgi:hypothetical protein
MLSGYKVCPLVSAAAARFPRGGPGASSPLDSCLVSRFPLSPSGVKRLSLPSTQGDKVKVSSKGTNFAKTAAHLRCSQAGQCFSNKKTPDSPQLLKSVTEIQRIVSLYLFYTCKKE